MDLKDLRKILVANRGEIALRIMRTIREMGKKSVSIYSEVDAALPFARYSDEAYPLRGKEARDTYLNMERIVSIAKDAGVEAIHPGYGFLSENAEFARMVEDAGIVFVGPKPETIGLMGDKTEARKLVAGYGVPVVPGASEPVRELSEASRIADEVGYPVLIKAAAGGGGKGMRLVHDPGELEAALRAARSESKSAFGDDRVFIEKYISNPRHIEFQILADNYGKVVHLFERECSIQRRHQKVVEETPSVALTSSLRDEMSKAAVDAARACGYRNAGTVEFILSEGNKYYFLEMNTRLQVEHPITELTVGVDIVREQIRIAEGQRLGLDQERIFRRGHAIECRIYAEDVFGNFYPDTGTIRVMREPAGPGVRVDSGIESGNELSVYYDSMIAKLSVWDTDRNGAIRRMRRALEDYVIAGVKTTIPFCRFVMESDDFKLGDYSTHFVENQWPSGKRTLAEENDKDLQDALILASVALEKRRNRSDNLAGSDTARLDRAWLHKRFED